MKMILAAVLSLAIGYASAAEYATVIAVKPHYVKPSCTGCMLPEQMGYDIWLEYKNRVIAQRVPNPMRVGDKWEVKDGRLVGKPISRKESDYRGPFPSNSSDS